MLGAIQYTDLISKDARNRISLYIATLTVHRASCLGDGAPILRVTRRIKQPYLNGLD